MWTWPWKASLSGLQSNQVTVYTFRHFGPKSYHSTEISNRRLHSENLPDKTAR